MLNKLRIVYFVINMNFVLENYEKIVQCFCEMKRKETWYLAVFRKAMEKVMAENLANMNMPTRAELTTLAGRMTNVEMRLDDMDAKLDRLADAIGARPYAAILHRR